MTKHGFRFGHLSEFPIIGAEGPFILNLLQRSLAENRAGDGISAKRLGLEQTL
jgi:hypothetical protein